MKIQQLIITFLLAQSFYCLPTYAQAILDEEHNLPIIGDKLPKVSLSDIDYSSKEIDLRGKITGGNEHAVEFIATADTCGNNFSKIEDGAIFHYSNSDNNIYLRGYESNIVKVSFDIPIKLIHYPFMLKDTVCCVFEGCGIYADKLPMNSEGRYILNKTAFHNIVTPDGDRIEEAYTLNATFDISLINASDPIHPTQQNVRLDSWNTYSEGSRYPILETRRYSSQGQILFSKTNYYPSNANSSLRYLALKEDERQKQLYGDESERSEDSFISDKHYKFSFSSEKRSAALEFHTDMDCDLQLILSSISGITYEVRKEHISANETKSINFNCMSLPIGQYALYVTMYTRQYVEKFNIK